MKTNCPMEQLLHELTDNYTIGKQETNPKCCVILFMKHLITLEDPLELIEAIRKEFEK